MSNETIARRYATALADVAMASGDAETVKSELAVWSELVVRNAELHNVLGDPTIAHHAKDQILEQLLDRTKPSKSTANFLRVLLQNGRLTDIPEINERFIAVVAERSGIVNAEVISARELPGDERTEFEKSLEKLTGKDMQITYSVDPSLIGGVVTRIGSTVYDGSVRTKLDNLRAELAGV
ncbi:MAG TPA: ATP synthase F1 subunit delta [Pyrinomonadaceae bacterium]|jgi:F-type H+-transporting ATPase subunit delta|nr:ATP synthase F1 subunit delta [Pyrinomonadaceae bacterium]